MSYKLKYLKYKNKYLQLKNNQYGGSYNLVTDIDKYFFINCEESYNKYKNVNNLYIFNNSQYIPVIFNKCSKLDNLILFEFIITNEYSHKESETIENGYRFSNKNIFYIDVDNGNVVNNVKVYFGQPSEFSKKYFFELLKREALEFYKQKNYIQAIKLYNRASKIIYSDTHISPDYFICKQNIAMCFNLLKEYNCTILVASQAILIDNLKYKIFNTRGIAYEFLGRLECALKDFKQLILLLKLEKDKEKDEEKIKEIDKNIELINKKIGNLNLLLQLPCDEKRFYDSSIYLEYMYSFLDIDSYDKKTNDYKIVKDSFEKFKKDYLSMTPGKKMLITKKHNIIKKYADKFKKNEICDISSYDLEILNNININDLDMYVDDKELFINYVKGLINKFIQNLFPICPNHKKMLEYLIKSFDNTNLLVPSEPNRQYGYNQTRLTPFLEDIIKYARNKNVLELGAGSGFLSILLLAGGAEHVEAYDISRLAIIQSNENVEKFINETGCGIDKRRLISTESDISVIRGDGESFAQPNYNCITLLNVIHYMSPSQIENTFRKISLCLTNNGVLFLNFDLPTVNKSIINGYFEEYIKQKELGNPYPGFLRTIQSKDSDQISVAMDNNPKHNPTVVNSNSDGSIKERGYNAIDIDTIQRILGEYSMIIIDGHVEDSSLNSYPLKELNDNFLKCYVSTFPLNTSLRLCLKVQKFNKEKYE